jgi:hypothetical protein
MEDTVTIPSFVTLAEGIIASDYALKNLNKALGEAQSEFLPAVKNEENKYGGYKYTPLSVIVSASRPSLLKHHLTVSQIPLTDLENKTIIVQTRLVHWDSGEWLQSSYELPAELALGKGGQPVFNQQTIGGSQTYAQKYSYKGVVGIPDSEEMIDSTEEKGDLPARSKTQQSRPIHAPEKEYVPRTNPDQSMRDTWLTAFSECATLDEFNQQIVPLAKEKGREFVLMMAEEAKKRGYLPDRATGLYIERRAQ